MKILVCLLLFFCAASSDNDAVEEFAKGYQDFAIHLYKQIAPSQKGNFLICPISLDIILALVESGAKSKTAEQIKTALHLPEEEQTIQKAIQSILSSLTDNSKYTLETANRAYIQKGFQVNKQFKSVAVEVYGSDIENVDFSKAQETADTINSWVEKETHGTIQNLIDSSAISSDMVLMLVNTLYFQADWNMKFEISKMEDFYISPDQVVQTEMMSVTGSFNYTETQDAQFLQLLFVGRDASLWIVLPKSDLSAVEEKIDKVLKHAVGAAQTIEVVLPSYLIDSKFDLKETLQEMGMVQAFGNNADLSGISGNPGDLKIDKVVQKTHIKLNQTGVEASAATGVGVVTTSVVIPQKKFVANKPFIFYIEVDGLCIFEGRVVDPTKKEY